MVILMPSVCAHAAFAQQLQVPTLTVGRVADADRPYDGDYHASLQGLIQCNRRASTLSSNIQLAVSDRSGTGFFLVYNDRRDTSPFTSDDLLGRSFVAKSTRLFDY